MLSLFAPLVLAAGEVYNIGTDLELSNGAVAEAILRGFDVREEDFEKHIEYVPDRLFNDKRYAVDSSKMHQLGWKPTTTWEDGLQRTRTAVACVSSLEFPNSRTLVCLCLSQPTSVCMSVCQSVSLSQSSLS
jgi:GDP-mannose 4,6 dehydratase